MYPKIITLILSLFGGYLALAQVSTEDTIYQDDSEQLEHIEIIGNRPTIALDALNHQVIHKEFLLKNQANTFIQSLDILPGISSIQAGAGISKPVIRGMSMNRVIVNELGIKQENQQWGLDHGLEIDQYNVEEVEIIKGPVALIYGSDGIGGAINVLPPKRLLRDTQSCDITANYKTGNQLLGGSGRYIFAKNNWNVLVRISYQNYADYRVPSDSFYYNTYRLPLYNQKLKNTAGREWNQSIMLRRFGNRSNHTLFISNVYQKAGFFPGAFGIPRHFQLLPDASERNIDKPHHIVNHTKAIYNGRFFLPLGILKSDIGIQRNLRKEISNPHAHGNTALPNNDLALGLQLITFTANHALEIQRPNWQAQVGVSFQYQNNQSTGFEFLSPDFIQTQLGVYSYAQGKLTPQLKLSGGIRYDFAYQNAQEGYVNIYDNNGSIIDKTLRSPAYQNHYHNISGGLGIKYHFLHDVETALHVGTAYRIPLINELLSNGVHHGNFRHEMGDSSLKPERGLMLDWVLDYHTTQAHLSLTPFLSWFDNYIYLHPSGKFSPLPEAGQIYLYKNTPALFTGAELQFDYKFSKVFQASQNIEYVWNKNLENKQGLPFTPPFSARTELNISLDTKSADKVTKQFTLVGHYFAAQHRVDINEPPTPGYYLVHAMANVSFPFSSKRLSVFINIQNLLNKRYLNNMSRYRLLNLPEQGINAQILVRLEF